MVKLFFLLGLALFGGGIAAAALGWPYLVLETGFTQVIIGTVAATGGLVMLALARLLAEIRAFGRDLAAVRLSPAAPAAGDRVAAPAAGGLTALAAGAAAGALASAAVGRPGEPAPEAADAVDPALQPSFDFAAPAAADEPELDPLLRDLPEPFPDLALRRQADALSESDDSPAAEPAEPEPEHDWLPEIDHAVVAPATEEEQAPPASAEAGEEHDEFAMLTERLSLALEPQLQPQSEDVLAAAESWMREPEAEPESAETPADATAAAIAHELAEPAAAPAEIETPAPAAASSDPEPEQEPESAAAEPAASEEGVVGAYQVGDASFTLYSNGSILARTPDGQYRFGSMEELKEFLANEKSRVGL